MAAVVRVKRRRNEEPADSLIVSCKRGRLDSEQHADTEVASADVKTVFKFAGTVPLQASDNVSDHIRSAIRKEKLEKEYKHHNVALASTAQARRQHSKAARNSRYKITAKHRGPNLEALDKKEESSEVTASNDTREADETQRQYHLYDVVQDGSHPQESNENAIVQQPSTSSAPAPSSSTITCNGVPMQRTRVEPPNIARTLDSEYVYDLYYMNNYQFDFRMLENVLAIEAQHAEDLYFDYRDDATCEVYDDDSDSNDEDNWRNDYPDEDPHFYENETAEYAYGDDGHNPDHAFDEDMEDIATLIEKKLLGDKEESSDEDIDGADAGDGEIYSDVVDSDLDDEVPNGNSEAPAVNAQPRTRSYDAYKRQILRELGEAT